MAFYFQEISNPYIGETEIGEMLRVFFLAFLTNLTKILILYTNYEAEAELTI